MKRGQISNVIRKLRLIYWTDWARFYLQKFKNQKINSEFKKNNPDVVLPPDYLMYESFQVNYNKYYTGKTWKRIDSQKFWMNLRTKK